MKPVYELRALLVGDGLKAVPYFVPGDLLRVLRCSPSVAPGSADTSAWEALWSIGSANDKEAA